MKSLNRVLKTAKVIKANYGLVLSKQEGEDCFEPKTIFEIVDLYNPKEVAEVSQHFTGITKGEFSSEDGVLGRSTVEPFDLKKVRFDNSVPCEIVYELTEDWNGHSKGTHVLLFDSGILTNDAVLWDCYLKTGEKIGTIE